MSRPSQRGFTMLEIAIVAVILAIALALAIPRFVITTQRSRQTEAEVNLQAIRNAQIRYFQDRAVYATDAQRAQLGLDAWPSGWYRYCIINVDAADFEAVATPNSGTNPSVSISKNGVTDPTTTDACP